MIKNYTTAELQEELQRRKEEAELSPEMRLAEKLHSMLCFHNHTDGCDWYYGSWENPSIAKKQYLEKARRALKIASEDIITRILSAVE
jgi:hypothetical protein